MTLAVLVSPIALFLKNNAAVFTFLRDPFQGHAASCFYIVPHDNSEPLPRAFVWTQTFLRKCREPWAEGTRQVLPSAAPYRLSVVCCLPLLYTLSLVGLSFCGL